MFVGGQNLPKINLYFSSETFNSLERKFDFEAKDLNLGFKEANPK